MKKSVNYSHDIWLRCDSKTGLYYLTTEVRGLKFKEYGYPTLERYLVKVGGMENPRETERVYISDALLKYFGSDLPKCLDAELIKTKPWTYYLVPSNTFQTFIILLDKGGLVTFVEKLPRNTRNFVILPASEVQWDLVVLTLPKKRRKEAKITYAAFSGCCGTRMEIIITPYGEIIRPELPRI